MSEHPEPSGEQPEPSAPTPEGQLLRAIFGKGYKKNPEDRPQLTEVERAAKEAALRDKINQALKTLTDEERKSIQLRYGLGDGKTYTLEEVGKAFDETRECVRQIEAKALQKIQKPLRSGW